MVGRLAVRGSEIILLISREHTGQISIMVGIISRNMLLSRNSTSSSNRPLSAQTLSVPNLLCNERHCAHLAVQMEHLAIFQAFQNISFDDSFGFVYHFTPGTRSCLFTFYKVFR